MIQLTCSFSSYSCLLLNTQVYQESVYMYGHDVQLHTYIHNKTWINNAMGCVNKTRVSTLIHEC